MNKKQKEAYDLIIKKLCSSKLVLAASILVFISSLFRVTNGLANAFSSDYISEIPWFIIGFGIISHIYDLIISSLLSYCLFSIYKYFNGKSDSFDNFNSLKKVVFAKLFIIALQGLMIAITRDDYIHSIVVFIVIAIAWIIEFIYYRKLKGLLEKSSCSNIEKFPKMSNYMVVLSAYYLIFSAGTVISNISNLFTFLFTSNGLTISQAFTTPVVINGVTVSKSLCALLGSILNYIPLFCLYLIYLSLMLKYSSEIAKLTVSKRNKKK